MGRANGFDPNHQYPLARILLQLNTETEQSDSCFFSAASTGGIFFQAHEQTGQGKPASNSILFCSSM